MPKNKSPFIHIKFFTKLIHGKLVDSILDSVNRWKTTRTCWTILGQSFLTAILKQSYTSLFATEFLKMFV